MKHFAFITVPEIVKDVERVYPTPMYIITKRRIFIGSIICLALAAGTVLLLQEKKQEQPSVPDITQQQPQLATTTIPISTPTSTGEQVATPSRARIPTYTAPAATSTLKQPTAKPMPVSAPTPIPAPIVQGKTLYVDADQSEQYLTTAKNWQSSRPSDAAFMEKMGHVPIAVWLAEWSDIPGDVTRIMSIAGKQNALPVFVLYNIPNRDCGEYSAGGLSSDSAYLQWVDSVTKAIGNKQAVLIVEPDALATDCETTSIEDREKTLKDVVAKLKTSGTIKIYLDAGNSAWQSASEMAKRLNAAGVEDADGFALNVSNFRTDAETIAYGKAISSQVGNKHFVIDTSRNGNGPKGEEWCNPAGRALGRLPTTMTGVPLVDAYLWIKAPGESDGDCNGAPDAGEWMPEYALGLAQRAAYWK